MISRENPDILFSIVERGGVSIERMLMDTNPTESNVCGRDCFVCNQEGGNQKRNMCRKSSSLTQKNVSDLERVQKSAVRIIFGKNYESYSDTLSELGMKSLAVRRNILCLKFAKKSLKIENFGHLFPLNSKSHNMKTRDSNCYKVSKSYGKRYQQSAIPSMQRLLNRDMKEQKESLRKLSRYSVTSKLCLL